jgi:iron complex outermembrane recepter protein
MIKKTYYIFIALIVCTITLSAQTNNAKISGVVSNTSGEPLGSALVFIAGQNKAVFVDEDGSFLLNSFKAGTYLLEVHYLGYSDYQLEIMLSDGEHKVVNISLEPSGLLVNEIVIIDEQSGLTSQTPYNIASISARGVELKGNPGGLMGMIRTEPGVYGAELGQGIVKPFIRGLGFSRVVTIYQGNKLENHQWGADHGLGLNDLGVKSIDVIKGPASILYGSGAIGGVLLVKDEDNYKKAPHWTGMAGMTYNSLSGGFRPTLSLGRSFGSHYFFGADAAYENHADYLDGNGRIIGNSRLNTRTFRLHTGIDKKNFKNKISYSNHKQQLGIIEDDEMDDEESLATTRFDRTIQLPFQAVSDQIISYQQSTIADKWVTSLSVSHHINNRKEVEEDFDEVDLGLLQNHTFYNARATYAPGKGLEHTFGLQGSLIFNRNLEDVEEILIPDANLYDNGIYYMAGYTKGKSFLQGGLRFDFRRVVADASSEQLIDYGFILPGDPESRMLTRDFAGWTGSLGWSYDLNIKHRFKANISTGFRAPDLAELFSNGPHPGTNRFEIGNANFGREQSVQADINWSYTGKYIWLSSSLFANRVDNYIFFAGTGVIRPEDGLELWSFNQAPVQLYGTEVSAKIFPMGDQKLFFTADYSIVRAERRDIQENLTFIPADNLRMRAQYQWGENPSSFAFIGAWLVANQKRPGLNEMNTDGYYLLNAGLSHEISVGNNSFNVGVSAFNILNQVYVDHMSILRAFNVHQAGRNIMFNLQYRF